MAPPRSHGAKSDMGDEASMADERSRVRLVSRARGTLTAGDAAEVGRHEHWLPAALRRADGADIVKRNAHRRKKYLLVFPGRFKVTAGTRVGRLCGLNSRTPTLDVEFGKYGRLRFKGALAFPKNSLISIRARKDVVGVEDVFETLVVFAEWAWIGTVDSNPGAVPEPLPSVLCRQIEEDKDFAAARIAATPGKATKRRRKQAVDVMDVVGMDSEEGSDEGVSFDEADVNVGDSVTPRRSLPSRSNRSVDYSKMCQAVNDEDDADDDDDEDDAEEEKSEENIRVNSSETEKDEDVVMEVKVSNGVRPVLSGRRTLARNRRIKGESSSEEYMNTPPRQDVGNAVTPKRNVSERRKPKVGVISDNISSEEEKDDEDFCLEDKPKINNSVTPGRRDRPRRRSVGTGQKQVKNEVDSSTKALRTRRQSRNRLFESSDEFETE